MAGVNILWVAYKGIAPAMTAAISGEVQMSIASPGAVLPHLQAGRLRALGITSATPSPLFPSLPTIKSAGIPDFEMIAMTGIFAPAKTPAAIVNRLNQEIARALSTSEVKEKFLSAGVEIMTGSPEQFGAAVKADASRIGRVIKEANIRLE